MGSIRSIGTTSKVGEQEATKDQLVENVVKLLTISDPANRSHSVTKHLKT